MSNVKLNRPISGTVYAYYLFNALCLALVVFYVVGLPTKLRVEYVPEITAFLIVWLTVVYFTYLGLFFEQWCESTKRSYLTTWYEQTASLVTIYYRPLVRLLRGHDQVALASRELIIESEKDPIFLNGLVIFLGAASNQSDKSQRDSLANFSEENERTPAQVYQGAIEELMGHSVPVIRVISLLTSNEFDERSIEKKKQYLSWLRNQIAQLKRNRNYVIYENKRAPKWGSSSASIFTSKGFLQFTSSIGDALLVKDAWISRHLIESVMLELAKANPSNKTAYTQMEAVEFFSVSAGNPFGQNLPAVELEAIMRELNKKIHKPERLSENKNH